MYTVNLQFPLASSADISATLRRVVLVLATYRWLLGHWGVLRVAYLNIITGNDRVWSPVAAGRAPLAR